MDPSSWDLAKDVLYTLCAAFPDHTDTTEVITKINLVGRAYAATLERGRDNTKRYPTNEDFYQRIVAPKVMESALDEWIAEARAVDPTSLDALEVMVRVHGELTNLFVEMVPKLTKRSLASKYLHSHVPGLFYIYDSRAANAIGKLGKIVGRAQGVISDNEDVNYRKFAQKCRRLTEFCGEKWGLHMSPTDVDTLLLSLDRERRQPKKKAKTA